MFIFFNNSRDASDPRDEFLATLVTNIKKDIKKTRIPYFTDGKGGRCIDLPPHYNRLIYTTLSKY